MEQSLDWAPGPAQARACAADAPAPASTARRSGMTKTYRSLAIPAPAVGVAAGPGESWHFCGAAIHAAQGWKLYVSATLHNFLEILGIVGPILAEHDVAYKYPASEKVLRKLNAGLIGYSQVGKCIIAYLPDEGAVAALLPRLKAALRPFARRCPQVPFARPVGGGLPLFYRFGAYVGNEVRIGGKRRKDRRNAAAAAVPKGMADPFLPFVEPEAADADVAAFLARYPLFEAIAQGGKGAVFGGFDPDQPDFTEIVAKLGYRNGQVMPDARDGFDLLRREALFFEALAEAGLGRLAPRRIAYAEFRDMNALVMERLPGDNLMTLRRGGALPAEAVACCVETLEAIHRKGLFLGDAKLANFVLDAEGRPRAVDFECAGHIAEAKFDPLRTFRLYNPEIGDLATLDVAHFLYSAIYEGNAGPDFSERDRLIDVGAVLAMPAPADPAAAFALARFRALLG